MKKQRKAKRNPNLNKKWNGRYPCPINHINGDLLMQRVKGLSREAVLNECELIALATLVGGAKHSNRRRVAQRLSVLNFSVRDCRVELKRRGV